MAAPRARVHPARRAPRAAPRQVPATPATRAPPELARPAGTRGGGGLAPGPPQACDTAVAHAAPPEFKCDPSECRHHFTPSVNGPSALMCPRRPRLDVRCRLFLSTNIFDGKGTEKRAFGEQRKANARKAVFWWRRGPSACVRDTPDTCADTGRTVAPARARARRRQRARRACATRPAASAAARGGARGGGGGLGDRGSLGCGLRVVLARRRDAAPGDGTWRRPRPSARLALGYRRILRGA